MSPKTATSKPANTEASTVDNCRVAKDFKPSAVKISVKYDVKGFDALVITRTGCVEDGAGAAPAGDARHRCTPHSANTPTIANILNRTWLASEIPGTVRRHRARAADYLPEWVIVVTP